MTSPQVARAKGADWAYVQKHLVRAQFDPTFIKVLKKNYDKTDFYEVLELNTLLFLRKADYHGTQVDLAAAGSVRRFVSRNHKAIHKSHPSILF